MNWTQAANASRGFNDSPAGYLVGRFYQLVCHVSVCVMVGGNMRLVKTLSVVVLAVLASAGVFVEPALAADEVAAAGGVSLGHLAAGFGLGIGVFGGALGQSKVVASALESISRNPGASGQMNQPIILGLAFIESLVLFCFLVTGKLAGLF